MAFSAFEAAGVISGYVKALRPVAVGETAGVESFGVMVATVDDAGEVVGASRSELNFLSSVDDVAEEARFNPEVMREELVVLSETGSGLATACSFAGSTPVLMADGTAKPISRVRVGDEVMTRDPYQGYGGARRVVDTVVHDDVLVDLSVAGSQLVTTAGHPFWSVTEHRFVPAEGLASGDRLLTSAGDTVKVDGSVSTSGSPGAAYNLSVEGVHTFFVGVGGRFVLVHNQGASCETIWQFGWAKRGMLGELAVLARRGWEPLPRFFKTFDHFLNGVATSIKSMDLTGVSYTVNESRRVTAQLKRYIDKMDNFEVWRRKLPDGDEFVLRADQITSRRLVVVVRDEPLSRQLIDRFNEAEAYARELFELPAMPPGADFMDLPDAVIQLEKIA